MEGYIKSVLKKYEHPLPSKPQHALHKHCEITYGAKLQLIPNTKTYPALDIAGIQRVQGIVGAIVSGDGIVLFSLIVDNFGIEYVEERHAKHLLATLKEHYTITTD